MGGERPILENFRSIPQGLLSDRFFNRLIILEAQEHVEMLAKTIEINQNAHCLIPHSFSASLETKNTSIPLQPCPDDVDRKIGYKGWGVRAKCSVSITNVEHKNRLNCDIAQNPWKPRMCLFPSNFDLKIRWQICVWGMWSQGHVQHWMTHFKRKKQLKHIKKHHCSKSLAPLSGIPGHQECVYFFPFTNLW